MAIIKSINLYRLGIKGEGVEISVTVTEGQADAILAALASALSLSANEIADKIRSNFSLPNATDQARP